MTLLERLDAVIKELGISDRELARRAGLAEGHVGLLRSRLRTDPGAVTLTTLEAIAKGAGVSVAWLVAGSGDPHATGVAPAKAAAAERARAEDVWEAAIRSVLAEQDPGDEARPAHWWLLRMKMREIELMEEAAARSARAQTTAPSIAADPPPPSSTEPRPRRRSKKTS